METKLSIYVNIDQHGDDSYLIKRIYDSLLVVVCDGVTESLSGRIASNLITECIANYTESHFIQIDQSPLEATLKIIEYIKNEFSKLHEFIVTYNHNMALEINKNNDIIDAFNKYSERFKLTSENFSDILQHANESSVFSSTVNFFILTKIQDQDYWKMLSFTLGDGYFLQTRFNENNWEFKDLAFNRTTDDKTYQFSSTNGIYGNFELKESYLINGDIITFGTDGTKIRNLEYQKPKYQKEPFREFSAFLKDNINNFEQTSELWYNNVVTNAGLDDDFTLISILLGDYLSLSKDFESV